MVAGVEQYLGQRPGCHQDQKEGEKNETKARSQAPRQDAEEEAANQDMRRMRCEAWSEDAFAGKRMMAETLVRCPRCNGLFHSLDRHFCSIPERKAQLMPLPKADTLMELSPSPQENASE